MNDSRANSECEPATSDIRVLLADDQALIRDAFSMVVSAQADMRVVGEAADGQECLDVVARLANSPDAVDVVVMDIRMPRLDGLTATRAICEQGPTPRVLVLTTFDLDEYAFAALKSGAAGFMLKDAGATDLLAAIRAVHHGDAVVAPSTTARLLAHVLPLLPGTPGVPGTPGTSEAGGLETLSASGTTSLNPGSAPNPVTRANHVSGATASAANHPSLAPLTPREIEVLHAVGRGLSNTEISEELHLARATVKTHIGRILAKLGLRDRVHMVLLAYETGLIHPGGHT